MADPQTGAGGAEKPPAKPPLPKPRPGRPAARTAPAAKPGPTITRPATPNPGLSTGGNLPPPGRSAVHGKVPSPAAPAAKGTAGVRVSGRRLQELHLTASRRFAAPELALSSEEATELQDAMAKMGELTGFVPSGPFWDWLAVAWTIISIYGFRLSEIATRKAAAIAQEAGGSNAPPAAQTPPAPIARAAPAPPPPPRQAANPVGPGPVTINGNGAFVPMSPGATLDPIARSILSLNNGLADGVTPDVPGVPRTTLQERNGEL